MTRAHKSRLARLFTASAVWIPIASTLGRRYENARDGERTKFARAPVQAK